MQKARGGVPTTDIAVAANSNNLWDEGTVTSFMCYLCHKYVILIEQTESVTSRARHNT